MIRNVIAILIASLLLSSCQFHMYKSTEHSIRGTKKDIAQIKREDKVPAALTKSGFYVDTKPIVLTKSPAWLKRPITLEARNMPFELLVSRLVRNTNVVVDYAADVQRDKTVSLNFTGSIEGALKKLAAKTGIAYNVGEQTLNWSSFVTKTFNIAFMPGSSNYLVGQTPATSSREQSRTTSDSSVTTVRGRLNEQQYSNLKATLSVWDDLKKTLDKMKSPEGNVVVSEATTTVTVRDHPDNVQMMHNYIKQLNHNLSQQVSIKVQVLEVDLNKSYAAGIDWNAIGQVLGTRLSLVGALGTAANVSATGLPNVTSATTPLAFNIGRPIASESHSIIQALSLQGKTRTVTEPSVVTMNNQMAEVLITTDTSYLQSVNTTVTGAASTASTALTPGVVTDGFTLYLLPKIQDQRVYMQISSTISLLTSLNTVSSNTTADADNTTTIQVPTLSEKRFNLRSVVHSGSTLIIAGFKQLRDQTSKTKAFGSSLLGGRGSKSGNVETVLLITPQIIADNAEIPNVDDQT